MEYVYIVSVDGKMRHAFKTAAQARRCVEGWLEGRGEWRTQSRPSEKLAYYWRDNNGNFTKPTGFTITQLPLK